MTRPRILIIEDDQDVREALAEAIRDAGVQVELATDGLDGLERLHAGAAPGAILLDLRMPRLGGEEFLRQLRTDPRYDAVPVITMTGGPDRAPAPGGVAHLQKPFDLEDSMGIVLSLYETAPEA
ncbi:MAG: response regulator [Anaeromyxobacter sp.]